MSFRSGHRVEISLVFSEVQAEPIVVTLGCPPSLFTLKCKVVQRCPRRDSAFRSTLKHFYVEREGQIYSISDNRDVEELGGSLGSETMQVYSNPLLLLRDDDTSPPVRSIRPLRSFQLKRADVPVLSGTAVQIPICGRGESMVSALQNDGYFKIKLSPEVHAQVQHLYQQCSKWFAMPLEQKQLHVGEAPGERKAPSYGYRNIPSLQKELFVYRADVELPKGLKGSLDATFECLRRLGVSVIRAIMTELQLSEEEIQRRLEDIYRATPDQQYLQMSSFLEIFCYDTQYNNDGANVSDPSPDDIKVLCREHRDVGILTLIPRSLGPASLEMYNWKSGWTAVEESLMIDECLVFPGELYPFFVQGGTSEAARKIQAAVSHRVVVPVGVTEETRFRISAPFELLPFPLLDIDGTQSFQAAANLGKGLISENN